MKRLSLILLFTLACRCAFGQTVERRPDDFYSRELVQGQRPIPYAPLRETDVLWSTTIWKTIEVQELFNQFFYFPDDPEHAYGKKSLAYILWDAMAAGEIPIYEDDDMLIPLDNEEFVANFTKGDTIRLEIGYDDDDNEIYETFVRQKFFDGSEVLRYELREVWFIGKADTRQQSRRLALAPTIDLIKEYGSGITQHVGFTPLFWIPMQHPRVRTLLARTTAYIDPSNMASQPSWDWVFLNQYYSAYITRESNVYLRSLSDYLTGTDAILESEAIEDKLMEIESDLWEY